VAFGWTYFWTALLIPFTLGWIMPWRAVKLQGLLNNAMRFGNTPFRFEARSGPLYGRFAIAWVGTVVLFVAVAAGMAAVLFAIQGPPQMLPDGRPMPPQPATIAGMVGVMAVFYLLFGIVVAWYQAAALNHFAAHTSFAGAVFKGRVTAWSLIGLVLGNLLIVAFTLGLLAPVAQARSARYFVRRLSIEGTVPVAAIVQRAEDPMRRGEGLAQMFDVDAF
jgi:uncharacterized membrane protein YjgN (DUF898 family)